MRTTILRSAVISRSVNRPSVGLRLTRPMLSTAARFKSTQPPLTDEQALERRAALDRRDDLQKDWAMPIISYEAVKLKSLQPSEDAYLIDVREPDEVIQGSIPSSVNLPLSVLANSLQLDPVKFEEKHGFRKPKVEQEVVFYCRSGKRSSTASDVAKRNGYENILNYEGSWLDWVKREGKPSA